HAAAPELPTTYVYRVDPSTREITVAVDSVPYPNGLAFSPDERLLYVVESIGQRKIHAFDVLEGGARLGKGRVLIDAGPGTPDGFRCDLDGNLWCGWGMGTDELDGVRIFTSAGEPIGNIRLPERCAHV